MIQAVIYFIYTHTYIYICTRHNEYSYLSSSSLLATAINSRGNTPPVIHPYLVQYAAVPVCSSSPTIKQSSETISSLARCCLVSHVTRCSTGTAFDILGIRGIQARNMYGYQFLVHQYQIPGSELYHPRGRRQVPPPRHPPNRLLRENGARKGKNIETTR